MSVERLRPLAVWTPDELQTDQEFAELGFIANEPDGGRERHLETVDARPRAGPDSRQSSCCRFQIDAGVQADPCWFNSVRRRLERRPERGK